jgi:hypothetical protein
MKRTTAATSLRLLLIALLFGTFAPFAHAEWPKRVFAPYMYSGAGDDFKLTASDDACGVKYYTLAFFIARQERKPTTNPAGIKQSVFLKELTWNGSTPIDKGRYADQIDAIRKRGGDVIASFGGEGGRELAIIETDPVALQAQYQAVIDKYKFTWLDFDIEGANLSQNRPASERRNTVLAALQKKNPGLMISYTLPVDPAGISDTSQALLTDAVSKGLVVHSANLMVMYFGKRYVGKGKSEGQLGIESANKAHEQIQKISPDIQIGLCPCLGKNGSEAEVFGIEDANQIKAFADQTPWVCSLHYWSINDDTGKTGRGKPTGTQPWAFANIFKSFTSSKPQP